MDWCTLAYHYICCVQLVNGRQELVKVQKRVAPPVSAKSQVSSWFLPRQCVCPACYKEAWSDIHRCCHAESCSQSTRKPLHHLLWAFLSERTFSKLLLPSKIYQQSAVTQHLNAVQTARVSFIRHGCRPQAYQHWWRVHFSATFYSVWTCQTVL